MFESHPIPQQISSYQFRLVGDMTLKQFFQLAGGVLMSFLFYSTGLHPIIKWPLMILSVGLGAALAFLPFEERPLSQWMVAFFRSIYSPTLFNWIKSPANIKYFADTNKTTVVEKIIAPQGEEAMKQYLTALPQQKTAPVAQLENQEKNILGKITSLFSSLAPTKPEPTITPIIPTPSPVTQPIAIPVNQPVSIPARPKIIVEETMNQPQNTTNTPTLQAEIPVGPTTTPTFSTEAAPPSGPMIPNTLSGQVLDMEGGIIEGAILEIRDIAGRPVRALRSNKLGHFTVVTALANGHYEIITEKNNYEFDPVAFEANGGMIPSILIRAKSHQEKSDLPYTGKPLIIN